MFFSFSFSFYSYFHFIEVGYERSKAAVPSPNCVEDHRDDSYLSIIVRLEAESLVQDLHTNAIEKHLRTLNSMRFFPVHDMIWFKGPRIYRLQKSMPSSHPRLQNYVLNIGQLTDLLKTLSVRLVTCLCLCPLLIRMLIECVFTLALWNDRWVKTAIRELL